MPLTRTIVNPKRQYQHFITSYSVAPVDVSRRLFWVAVQTMRQTRELLADGQSAEILFACDELYHLYNLDEHMFYLKQEYNYFVKSNRANNILQFDDWNGTVTALIIVRQMLLKENNVNNKPLLYKVEKQLMYIRNKLKNSERLLRNCTLFYENIERFYTGKLLVNKTEKERREYMDKLLGKMDVTTFSFMDKTFIENGALLTLEECVKKWVEGYPQKEFLTGMDEQFYIKKYNIELVHTKRLDF
jgi:hypothetical protein